MIVPKEIFVIFHRVDGQWKINHSRSANTEVQTEILCARIWATESPDKSFAVIKYGGDREPICVYEVQSIPTHFNECSIPRPAKELQ